MKFRMSRILRFWVDVEYDDIKNRRLGRPRTEIIAQILRAYEESGDAMGFLERERSRCLEGDPEDAGQAWPTLSAKPGTTLADWPDASGELVRKIEGNNAMM